MVLLSDTGDTVFGGSSGDSNLILESMLRLGIQSPVLMPLIEPQTAAALAAAGEGATVTLALGGHSATKFFSPLTVTGKVGRIHRGMVPLRNYYQAEIDMGCTVLFQVGPVTLLVSEYRGWRVTCPMSMSSWALIFPATRSLCSKQHRTFSISLPCPRR